MENKISKNDIIKAYKQTFNTESGKEVLKHLESRCFYDKIMFNGNDSELNLREGMRFVLLGIKKKLEEEEK